MIMKGKFALNGGKYLESMELCKRDLQDNQIQISPSISMIKEPSKYVSNEPNSCNSDSDGEWVEGNKEVDETGTRPAR